MSSHHYAFGLSISSNEEIPGFAQALDRAPVDVEVVFGRLPDGIDPDPPPNDQALHVSPLKAPPEGPCSRVWRTPDGEYFRILYGDGTDCVVDQKGRQIWILWPEHYSLIDVVPYLQGQLLGFAQRLRGVVCLHASAIVVGEHAIAVTGPAEAGKSTTAATFLQMGYPILADDVVPVFEDGEKFMVRPAHQRLCLCPDTVETLFGSADALPQFSPSWDKRYLDLSTAGPEWPRGPRSLAAVYVLSERSSEPGRPAIVKARPRDMLLQLVQNTYVNHLLDAQMRSREFAFLSRLQRIVPVRLVRPHAEKSRIPELCRAILEDFRSRCA
jgi:hypothetical protein